MVILGVTGCLFILLLNHPVCKGMVGLPSTSGEEFDHGKARLLDKSAPTVPHST